MKCKYCGHEYSKEVIKFCPNCGSSLINNENNGFEINYDLISDKFPGICKSLDNYYDDEDYYEDSNYNDSYYDYGNNYYDEEEYVDDEQYNLSDEDGIYYDKYTEIIMIDIY